MMACADLAQAIMIYNPNRLLIRLPDIAKLLLAHTQESVHHQIDGFLPAGKVMFLDVGGKLGFAGIVTIKSQKADCRADYRRHYQHCWDRFGQAFGRPCPDRLYS